MTTKGVTGMAEALAYLNWGRWVVDCPQCLDAREVYQVLEGNAPPVRLEQDRCINGHLFDIVMPTKAQERQIMQAVDTRGEAERSWHPAEHGRANAKEREGTAASVAAMRQDSEARLEHQRTEAERAARLRETLRLMGVEVKEDGTFTGVLP
jgi:hypothetical protein